MARLTRAALLIAAVLMGFAIARIVAAWRAERRRKAVFPAAKAATLLNPLRGLFMPAARTLQRFGIERGQTVLELGPGPGYYTIEVSRMVGPTGRVLCLDIQRGMLDILAERLAANGASNVDMVVADAMRLPLKAASVDSAFLVTVLGEVPEAEAAVAELRRVIKPGGTLGFTETFGDPDYVSAGRLRALCGAEGFHEAGHWRNAISFTSVFVAAG